MGIMSDGNKFKIFFIRIQQHHLNKQVTYWDIPSIQLESIRL